MDKTTITAVREAIKGDALTDAVKDKLGEIESFYDEMIAKSSKTEDLQKDLDSAKIDLMAEKGRRQKAESRIESLKELVDDSESKLKNYDTLKAEVDTLKSDNESLKTVKEQQDKQVRSDYLTALENVKKQEAFSKWEDDFIVPTDEKKLEEYDIGEVVKAKAKLDKYIERGVFDPVDTRTGGGKGKPDPKHAQNIEEKNRIRRTMGLPPLKE